jgi:hypothetical protein
MAELLSKFGCGQTAEGVTSTFGGRPSEHPMRNTILLLLRMIGKRSFSASLRFAYLQQRYITPSALGQVRAARPFM